MSTTISDNPLYIILIEKGIVLGTLNNTQSYLIEEFYKNYFSLNNRSAMTPEKIIVNEDECLVIFNCAEQCKAEI